MHQHIGAVAIAFVGILSPLKEETEYARAGFRVRVVSNMMDWVQPVVIRAVAIDTSREQV